MDCRTPTEIWHRILRYLDPIELDRLARASSFTHKLIYANSHRQHIWQSQFLNHFDHPLEDDAVRNIFLSHPSTTTLASSHQVDWLHTLATRIILRNILTTADHHRMTELLIKHYPDAQLLALYDLIFLILNTAQRTTDSLNLTFLKEVFSSNPTAQLVMMHQRSTHLDPIFAERASLHDPVVRAAAKLHTLYGLTSYDVSNSLRTRGMARESCYALANYTPHSLYGPFVPDQSCTVNWPHLEALSVVVGLNLYSIRKQAIDNDHPPNNNNNNRSPTGPPHELPTLPVDPPLFSMPDTPGYPHPAGPILQHLGSDHPRLYHTHTHTHAAAAARKPELIPWPILDSLHASRPHTQLMHPAYEHPPLPWPPLPSPASDPLPLDLNHYDWAGVSGRWLRVVCYLDYRLFHDYNFGRKMSTSLNDCSEVLRIMTLELNVIAIGTHPESYEPQHIPMDVQTNRRDRPPIYFEGTSAYNVGASRNLIVGQAVSQVRGCVSMTVDGEVRWTLVSTLGGVDRWASEGIQVGGVRARWGVVGVWSDVNRDEVDGPVGPFYFFKTSY
ncbi:hypothetical protein PCANC_02386 [Puccinia coronata f. sp. avenae]|uniref:F-box domain-containing protein n=1 Tax=Puccinia coronata f. sp. avenae TaxID=200324 RepID=A0A2N5W4Y9_9BASI|nr:hypothetical protein PCANC_02386 [Puccinia coronata f. sp. avenae]